MLQILPAHQFFTLPFHRTALRAGMLFIVLLFGGSAARADPTAVNFLAPYLTKAQSHGTMSSYYGLYAVIVTNQPDGKVSYIGSTGLGAGNTSQGDYTGPAALGYYSFTKISQGPIHIPKIYSGFSGIGNQSFKDRQWGPSDIITPLEKLGYSVKSPTGQTLSNPISFPFNPYKQDAMGIDLDALAGAVTLTLKSWGNKAVRMDLHAQNGILIGSGYTIGTSGGSATVVISITDYYAPPPPTPK